MRDRRETTRRFGHPTRARTETLGSDNLEGTRYPEAIGCDSDNGQRGRRELYGVEDESPEL